MHLFLYSLYFMYFAYKLLLVVHCSGNLMALQQTYLTEYNLENTKANFLKFSEILKIV
jgi:hypothetical protein